MTRWKKDESRPPEPKPLSAHEAGKLVSRTHETQDAPAAPPVSATPAEYIGGKALTYRQRQILQWISDSWSNERIATEINREPGTVAKHLESLFKRLGVHSRTDAVIVFLKSQIEECQRKRALLVRRVRRLVREKEVLRSENARLKKQLAKYEG